MIRLFKPGDRVQLKSGGTVMEVMKYITEQHPLVGNSLSKTQVECSWYTLEEGRKTRIFHQHMLEKVPLAKATATVMQP